MWTVLLSSIQLFLSPETWNSNLMTTGRGQPAFFRMSKHWPQIKTFCGSGNGPRIDRWMRHLLVGCPGYGTYFLRFFAWLDLNYKFTIQKSVLFRHNYIDLVAALAICSSISLHSGLMIAMYLNFIVKCKIFLRQWTPNIAGYVRKANKNAFMGLLNFFIAIIRWIPIQ